MIILQKTEFRIGNRCITLPQKVVLFFKDRP